jgi:predicted Holliday junction resolvase-like endonuclease
MTIMIIILFIISIVLIGISFLQRDNVKELEQELDHLQLSAMQEIYKLKKKMRVVEEELLQNDTPLKEQSKTNSEDNQANPNTSRILAKYRQRMSIEAIALSEGTTVEEIRALVEQNERVLT